MTENDTTQIESFLKDHPRLLGVLFGAVVLLSQAGAVAATNSCAYNGGP